MPHPPRDGVGASDAGWLHGLKVVAVAVVAQAVWGMARSLAPNRERGTIAVVAAADFSLAIVCLALLVLWKIPPWLVVVVAAIAGAGIAAAQGGG